MHPVAHGAVSRLSSGAELSATDSCILDEHAPAVRLMQDASRAIPACQFSLPSVLRSSLDKSLSGLDACRIGVEPFAMPPGVHPFGFSMRTKVVDPGPVESESESEPMSDAESDVESGGGA